MHEFHFGIINRALPSKYYKLAFGSDGLRITADLWLSNSNVSESPAGPRPKNVCSNKFPEGILLLVLDVTWRTKCSEASQVIIIFSSLLSFSPCLGKLHRKLSQRGSPRGLSVLQTPGSQAEAASVNRGRLVLRALGTRVYLTDKPTVGAQQTPQATSPSLGVLCSLSPSASK